MTRVPGWLRGLSVCLGLRSQSSPALGPCSAGSLLPPLSPPFPLLVHAQRSLSLSCSCCLANKLFKKKKEKYYDQNVMSSEAVIGA